MEILVMEFRQQAKDMLAELDQIAVRILQAEEAELVKLEGRKKEAAKAEMVFQTT